MAQYNAYSASIWLNCESCCDYQSFECLSVLLFPLSLSLSHSPFLSPFLPAVECFLDSDLSFLVPIAVGVALSFLIILVLISYLIGRRKSRTGYQSV